MCTSHDHNQGEATQAGAARRSFLRATALLSSRTKVAVELERFCANIRRERVSRNLTQERLAELADLIFAEFKKSKPAN